MKTIIVISSLLVLILMGCAKTTRNPIEGAWKLVYSKYVISDSIIHSFPGDMTESQVKMWSGDHFVFAGWYKVDTVKTDTYGFGTWSMNDSLYTETIDFNDLPSVIGKTLSIKLAVKNDTLTQKFSLMENAPSDESKLSIEKYIRLK